MILDIDIGWVGTELRGWKRINKSQITGSGHEWCSYIKIFFVNLPTYFFDLRTLDFRKAQTYKDAASNNNLDFLTFYYEILDIEGHQNLISGSKVMVL